MGASWFCNNSYGKNVKDAYDKAVERAEEEHGHQQGYSGEINCSAGYRDITKEFKASGKSLMQFMNESADRLTKHQGAQAICLEEPRENKNKIKTQVEHVVVPGTKKWVLKYVVYSWDNKIGAFNTKGEALKKAREYTEKNEKSTNIVMEKCLEKGTTTVARVTYKKSSDEKEGKWVFFGWASY